MKFFLLNGAWAKNANDAFLEKYIIGPERSIFGNILNFIRVAGTGIALIMLTYMSISYFTADGRSMPGGLERKADIKGKQLTRFAIGAAVFIGASNILYFISTFIEDIMNEVF